MKTMGRSCVRSACIYAQTHEKSVIDTWKCACRVRNFQFRLVARNRRIE